MTEQMVEQLGGRSTEHAAFSPVLRAVPSSPQHSGLSFAGSMAAMAQSWQQSSSGADGRVADIVAGAVGVVPGCEQAGLVILENNILVARAVSESGTSLLIALQNELGQGPCRDAAMTKQIVRVPDLRTDPRWPGFAHRAHTLGVASMLCTPLTVGSRTYGSLSMASARSQAFDAESESLAAIFAAHAAVALADADRVQTLTEAIDSRDLIGQAKGILMARERLTADQAFAVLVRESKSANIKLRQVAHDLCQTGKLPSAGTR